LCDPDDEVVKIELLRQPARGDFDPASLWILESDDGFGSNQWFTAGAAKPGEGSPVDPEVTAEIEEPGSDSFGFKAYTRSGDWFEVWFGFEGTRTDGRIPSDGSMTTGRIDAISGDQESLDQLQRDSCEGPTTFTGFGLAAAVAVGGLVFLTVVGTGFVLWRRRNRSGGEADLLKHA
jgi:hypothetical protein